MLTTSFKATLAVTMVLIGTCLACGANAQATSVPTLSAKEISGLQQMISGLSPEMVNQLLAEAMALQHVSSGGQVTAQERQELKAHKAELQELRTQVCSTLIAC